MKLFVTLSLFVCLALPGYAQNRTIIDTEQGSFFSPVTGLPSSAYGMFIMVSSNTQGSAMAPQALKADYSRIEGFAPNDDNGQWPYFPYSQFKAFEASEVAAGRAPLFMTATYQGKHRPLVIFWDLFLNSNGQPTTDPSTWHYAVNVGDPRFINFWVNNYIRPILWNKVNTNRNTWIGLDENPVSRSLFGVIDDSGHYVSPVPWDQPFPQTNADYMAAMKAFFDGVHTLAPEIRLAPNVGRIDDPTQYASIFANSPGVVYENFWDGPAPVAYTRNAMIQSLSNVATWGESGKVAMIRETVSSSGTTQLLSGFALYELVKGPNYFFAPMYAGNKGAPPSLYQPWQNLLGKPAARYTSTPQVGARSGYNLYSRNYEFGIVYLNWTGVSKTITLPTNATYYNPSGSAVKSITIPDGVGTFVSTAQSRVAAPKFNARYSLPVYGPISVSLTSATANAQIHYTLNGTVPTQQSPIYQGALTLSQPTTVSAVAFLSGMAQSSLSIADYDITSMLPSVQFDHSPDHGAAGNAFPVLALNSVTSSPISVAYTVRQPNGTSSSGTATVLPGDPNAHFTVPVTGIAGNHVVVTLTSATNATLGASILYNYVIQ